MNFYACIRQSDYIKKKEIDYFSNKKDIDNIKKIIKMWNDIFKIDYFSFREILLNEITIESLNNSGFDEVYLYENEYYSRKKENKLQNGLWLLMDNDDCIIENFTYNIEKNINIENEFDIFRWLYTEYKTSNELINIEDENNLSKDRFHFIETNHSLVRIPTKENKEIFHHTSLDEYSKEKNIKTHNCNKILSLNLKSISSLSCLYSHWQKMPKIIHDKDSLYESAEKSTKLPLNIDKIESPSLKWYIYKITDIHKDLF